MDDEFITGELISGAALLWIQVTEMRSGRVFHLNADHIVGLSPRDGGGTTVFLTTRSDLIVDETVDELTAPQ